MNLNRFIGALLVISTLVAIVVILWYLLGSSPTPDQLLWAVVLPLYIYIFYTREKFNEKLYKTREGLLKEISETREKLLGELSEIKQALGKK
ncbi:MAG: hypothetical protein AABX13_01325 [Nanoarchaeota archaeon]